MVKMTKKKIYGFSMGFLWLKFTKKISMVFLWLTIGFKNAWLYHGYGLIWVENSKPDPWRTLIMFIVIVSVIWGFDYAR